MADRWIHPVLLLAALAAPAPSAAEQNDGVGPAMEIGIDGAVASDLYDGGGRPWGPRLILNLSPEAALVVFGESRVPKSGYASGGWSSRLFGIEIRHALAQAGPFTFNFVAGGGASFRKDSRGRIGTRTLPAVVLGAGFGERISRYATLRQECRLVLAGDGSELRAQVGLSVPIGRYRTGATIDSQKFGAATIRTGQHVWITRTDGAEVAGSVRNIDRDTIDVVTSTGVAFVRATEIQRIQRADRVRDGLKRGAVIGASAGAGLYALLNAACRGDCMGDGAAIVGAGFGGGLGMVFGTIVDGLNRNRETVFERAAPLRAATVTPLVRARSAGVVARVAW